jgi:hypothetical protein
MEEIPIEAEDKPGWKTAWSVPTVFARETGGKGETSEMGGSIVSGRS